MADVKLSKEKILILINLYKSHECLWNYKSSHYKRNDLENKAWQEISSNINLKIEEVKKKVKSLRSAYVAEKKKRDDSIKSGAGGDIYEPNLFYFTEFEFLNAAIVLRKSCSNIKEENIICEEEEVIEFPEETGVEATETIFDNTELNTNKRRRTKKCSESSSTKYDDAIEAIVSFAKQNEEEEDEYTSFGKTVAAQLKKFAEIDASTVMLEIQEILHKYTVDSINKHELKSLRNNPHPVKIISNKVIRSCPTSSSSGSNSSYNAKVSTQNSYYNITGSEESYPEEIYYYNNYDPIATAVRNANLFD